MQWQVTDDNLDADGMKLECRWVGSDSRWFEVKTRKFNARDEYTWTSLGKDRSLEVRLIARDKAGHEAVSKIIRLPDSNGGGRLEAMPLKGPKDEGRDIDSFPASQAQIVYVNRRDMTIRSKLTHVTRSGVTKVHLYVKDLTANGEWKFDKSQNCDIRFEAADKPIERRGARLWCGRTAFGGRSVVQLIGLNYASSRLKAARRSAVSKGPSSRSRTIAAPSARKRIGSKSRP